LEKAGVIDAGGKGYMYMLKSMLMALRGEILTKTSGETPSEKADFTQYTSEDIKFAYCTEFITEYKSHKDVNRLRDFLNKRGDSIVVVDDDDMIKIHVHTNEPGVILTEALTFGPLHDIKIENMREQHTENVNMHNAPTKDDYPPVKPEDMKPFAIVAVCAGAGIEEVFCNLGTDRIVTGGQTMNPSTEDIFEKVQSAPSDVVFILPNNKNIIMAAEQCAPLTDKRIIVIPTKSIPQGISALLAIDEIENIDDMQKAMTDAAKHVITAQITHASRNSKFDGKNITAGEYITLIDGSLDSHSSDFSEIVDSVSNTLNKSSLEFITIFSGVDANKEDTALLLKKLEDTCRDAEISVIEGKQPVYIYIISAE
jgi:DAK2 domain fusion protein YloV